MKSEPVLLSNPGSETKLLLYELCIHIPDYKDLCLRILRDRYDHPSAGHYDYTKTLDLVRRDYFWHRMRKFIVNYCRSWGASQERGKTALRIMQVDDVPHGKFSAGIVPGTQGGPKFASCRQMRTNADLFASAVRTRGRG